MSWIFSIIKAAIDARTPATQPPKRSIFTPQAEMPPLDIDVQPSPRRKGLPVSLSLVPAGHGDRDWRGDYRLTSFFQQSNNIEVRLESVSTQPAGNLEMTGAHYSGTTDNGMKFLISAERAVESASQKGLIRLFGPDGFVSSDKDGRTKLSSNEAVYHADERRLDLYGAVNIFQSRQQLTLTSEEMTALIGKGELLTKNTCHPDRPGIYF